MAKVSEVEEIVTNTKNQTLAAQKSTVSYTTLPKNQKVLGTPFTTAAEYCYFLSVAYMCLCVGYLVLVMLVLSQFGLPC